MLYKRIATTLAKYYLYPEDESIYKIIKSWETDHYESIFLYNEEQYQLWKKSKSVAGMNDVITRRLVFDFDSKEDITKAQSDAKQLIEKLMFKNIPRESIQVSFSGSKGFCINIDIKETLTQPEFKSIVFGLASEYETYDTAIHDCQRVIRVVGTKHPLSGLYKMPLTIEQISELTVTQIREFAKTNDNIDEDLMNSYVPCSLGSEILALKTPKVEKKVIELNVDNGTTIDLSRKPKWLSDAKYALQEGYFETGERSKALMIMASTYKAQGFSKEVTYRILKGIIEKQSARTGQAKFDSNEIWVNIIGQVYGPNWKNGTYSYEDTPLLQEVTKRYNLKVPNLNNEDYTPIVMSQLGGEVFKKYAESFFKTRIYTGLTDLDETFPICAGSNIAIVAAASAGKTALALNILRESNKQGLISVFASLDMSKSRLYEKMLYSVTDGKLSREELYTEYLNGKGPIYDELVQQAFPNTYIFSKSAPTIAELRKYIDKVQEHTGKPVRLLMVDYFERLNSDKSDDNSAAKEIAGGIQDLISDYPELTPITLYQPNKAALGGGPDKPVLNYLAIKGSSFIYQSARQIISLWRPMFTPELYPYDKFIEVAILKNDLGELGKFCYNWEGRTGLITNMSLKDKQFYEECMIKKEELEFEVRKKNYGGL